MGHDPDLYIRWHAEIEAIESGQSEKERRRRTRMCMAGYPDGVVPDGMVYAHGWVMTEAEARSIGDEMTALGAGKPKAGSAAYYNLAHKMLQRLHRGLGQEVA